MKPFHRCLLMTVAVAGSLILLLVLLFVGVDSYGSMAQVTSKLTHPAHLR